MNLLALFSSVVFAAITVVTPMQTAAGHPTVSFAMLNPPNTMSAVLGTTVDVSASTTATLVSLPTEHKSTRPLTIALLGDSMIDTLGPTFPALIDSLKEFFPYVVPTILNYGVGGTNIDYGIERITHDYDYLGRHVPSLASTHPDIVIIESFGYNPYSFDIGAIDKHWLALAHAVDLVKTTIPHAKILIAATIAPNAKLFGDGAAGLAFSPSEKQNKVNIIKSYLESTTRFAIGEKIPLVDAYHGSLLPDGNGNPDFINPGDHIHPSDAGKKFFADKIVSTLFNTKILE